MSFLALESDDDEDDKQWLTYWVVFGLFSIVDQFAGFILHWIPFYYFLKMGFLIWCFHPATQGATIVYNHYIREASKPLTDAMDEAGREISYAKKQMTDKVSGVLKRN
jgi:receptor expression-enhancing protein 5/6